MKKTIFALSTVALVSLSLASTAGAWERRGTVTGPYGNTYSSQGSIKPNGQGGYDYRRSVTGPGGTYTNSGSVKRNGDGSFSRQGQRTNPYGGGVTYGGTGQCSGGSCTYNGGRNRF